MWEMPWALVRRTNLLSVATKLDVPVFHAERVELGCTRHVHVNSSVSKGFSLFFLFQAVQNYERSSRCIRKQHCTVLSTKACSGDTPSVSLALEGHRQGNGSDVKCACAHLDAFRPDQTRVWAFCFLVGLPLENEASCKRCAHGLPLSSLVPATGCLLVTSQRRLLRAWENKSAQSLLHHPSPSLSTLTGYFQ